jgi:EmrB/QacA subfamily drug resistance transporter
MQYKWTALTVTTVGILMAGIDARIVIIGLPIIGRELHASASELIWVTQSFALSSTVCLLFIGRLSDQFGRVRLYNIGFTIFTLGSALCAFSQGPFQLIGFRIIQGLGSGILSGNSAAILTDAAPQKELGTILGINQVMRRVGTVIGLTIAGLIISFMSWRGLFYINIPIGIFGTLWSYLRLREISTKDPTKKMDWVGFALITGGLALTLLSLTFLSYGLSGFKEGLFFLIGGAVMIILFAIAENKISFPLLDPLLFKIRAFVAGTFARMLNAVSWTGTIVITAFYLEIGLGYSPLRAGIALVPMEVSFFVVGIICGRLSDKYGQRGLATLGIGIATTGLLLMFTLFTPSTAYPTIAVIIAFSGAGNGMFSGPNISSIMGPIPPNRRGIASSFSSLLYQIGSSTSYGLVLLFMTIGIPYTELSQLLQGTIGSPLLSIARIHFINGIRIAALILAIIDMPAILTSAMRGTRQISGVASPSDAEVRSKN